MTDAFDALPDRFWDKVQFEPNSGCWLWTGSLVNNGYSQFRYDDKTILAHRLSYEKYIGPIPKGLVIDHLCRVRCCVNPSHMEAVTQRTNVKRGVGPSLIRKFHLSKTHCPSGHPYDQENTYIDSSGHRVCKKCRNISQNKYRKHKKRTVKCLRGNSI